MLDRAMERLSKLSDQHKQNARGHQWEADEDGMVDIFAYNPTEPHNGPRCVRCGYGYCQHCQAEPEYDCPAPMTVELQETAQALGFNAAMLKQLRLNGNAKGGMGDTTPLDANLERLSNMGLLEANWNGYDAPKISSQVIDRVRSFLFRLPADRQPELAVPTGRGTVQLEYEDSNGKYLELDIGQSSIDVLYQPVDGDEIEEEGISSNRAIDLIQRYYAE